MSEPDNIQKIAAQISETLGAMVNDDQISPPEVVIGAMRGATVFWMGCTKEGTRVEAPPWTP